MDSTPLNGFLQFKGDSDTSRDLSHIEDMWKPPFNPKSPKSNAWKILKGKRQRGERHTYTNTFTETETHTAGALTMALN